MTKFSCVVMESHCHLVEITELWINLEMSWQTEFITFMFVGFRSLRPEVEEGICQVLAHMWLDSEIMAGSGTSASTSSSSSSSSSSSTKKKGTKSDFEKKLGEFFKYQIESDASSVYGDGFRAANKAVDRHGLRSTLSHIGLTGTFPLWNWFMIVLSLKWDKCQTFWRLYRL